MLFESWFRTTKPQHNYLFVVFDKTIETGFGVDYLVGTGFIIYVSWINIFIYREISINGGAQLLSTYYKNATFLKSYLSSDDLI